MEIIELIPYGEENAVKRKWLVRRCIEKGLVDADSKDPDREMRKLIHKAREKYVILKQCEIEFQDRETGQTNFFDLIDGGD